MVLKVGKPGEGRLTPRRLALVKEETTVGQWREKVIAAGLAPKADPDCSALLRYLVREGHLEVLRNGDRAKGKK